MSKIELDKKQTELLLLLGNIKLDELDGIKLDKVLFNVTSNAITYSLVEAAKDAIKRIICNSYCMSGDLSGRKLLLLSYDYKRSDHSKSWDTVKNMFQEYDEIKLSDDGFSKQRILSLCNIWWSFKQLIVFWYKLKRVGTYKERLVLSSYLVELVRLKKELEKCIIKSKVALTFFDGGSYENLLIQYFRNLGLKCVTMQHGQPVFHGHDVDRINQTMILNFSSDYVLVTGEFSKKQFMLGGIQENKIKVVGSLRKICEYREKNTGLFTVFLDCPTYETAFRDNCKMIEIAENIASKQGKHYYIKLHPQDSVEKYSKYNLKRGIFLTKEKTLENALVDAEFAILHASGVYLDILSTGVKSYCLETEVLFPLVDFVDDKFSSLGELEEKLFKWSQKNISERQVYMKRVVEYYLSPTNSEQRHKDFINSLLSQ